MPAYVGKIAANETLDATAYFDGPWRSLSRITVPAEQPRTFTADSTEFALFVMNGSGHYLFGGATEPISPGSAVTVGLGSEITVHAGEGAAVELFVTTLSVSTD
ncbi:hypothetical protein [Mycobacterium sp. NAZ190054]|uniref:hypothetical protein n=1 Tax=Mycobacterium sp. NAZ190054 TaxID=1747766 RepID=UPI000796C5A9|nr:hypothetical protein [Mycobacterium sp. NAZ190054]KWX66734.1 hypothetical protein ASJ79_24365 [Mycobacterium sp. NAZ190054]